MRAYSLMTSVATVCFCSGCEPPEFGFDALPSWGIYQVSTDEVEPGCGGAEFVLASEGERVAIEAFEDGSYRELSILGNPIVDEGVEATPVPTAVALSPIDDTLFYGKRELGVSGCPTTVETREYYAAVGSSIELTASTRWDGVAGCVPTSVTDVLPTEDCDATTIYDFDLVERCEDPCTLQREARLVRGIRRSVPVCSCSESTDTDGDPMTSG